MNQAQAAAASKPNAKRERENDENDAQRLQPNDKSQRLQSVKTGTTKITDLNDDCLVKIFGHLNIKNLFNIANTNGWLRPAARDVYKRKFDAVSVDIHSCGDSRNNSPAPGEEFGSCIKVCGLKATLLYLRLFGSSIDSLEVHYNASESHRYGYVHKYINDYCADSLVYILFEEMPNMAIAEFQNAFTNVTQITVRDCDYNQRPSFAHWFPNVRRLELVNTHPEHDLVVGQFIAEPFRHLESMRIDDDQAVIRSFNKYTELLRVHPYVTKFQMNVHGWSMEMDVLLDIIKHNTLITELAAKISSKQFRPGNKRICQQCNG